MGLIQEFFKFNRNERRGISILFVLVVILIYFRYRHKLVTYLYPEILHEEDFDNRIPSDSINLVSQAIIEQPKEKYTPSTGRSKSSNPQTNQSKFIADKKEKIKSKSLTRKYKIQNFDPNKIDSVSLVQMGINRYAISNWMKFRRKGGRIDSSEKLQSIYGLKEHEFDRIKDHLIFRTTTKKGRFVDKTTIPKQKFNIVLDINSATAEEFQKLRGIGPVFSKRIIKFRDLLGGFQNVDQINEVYGIEDSLFNTLIPHLQCQATKAFNYIPINEISQDSLKKHPYVNWKQAKLILQYRDQHGDFSDAEAFRKLRFLKEDDFRRIIPYLDFAPYTGTAL